MNKKLLSVVLTVLCAFLLFACSARNFSPYTYENTLLPSAAPDDGIDVDGVLSEDVWLEKEWMTFTYNDRGTVITLQMTSAFGEKGVYFALKCDDPLLYVNPSRKKTHNSGIELCVCRADETVSEGNSFELFMNADGNYEIRKRFRNVYSTYIPSRYENVPLFKSTVIDGKINSGEECGGYTMEVYLTNDLLGITGDTTKINASPSLVRMYSSELDDGSRMRYAFGPEKSGYAYLNPTTWYGFGESGFILSEISVEGEGITVTPSSDRIIPGEQTRLFVELQAGKTLNLLTADGIDVLSCLKTDENGKCYFDWTLGERCEIVASSGIAASAVEAELKFHDSSVEVSEDRARGFKVYFTCGGAVYPFEFESGCTFACTAPETEGVVTVFESGALVYEMPVDFSGYDVFAADLNDYVKNTIITPAYSASPNASSTVYNAEDSEKDVVAVMDFGYYNDGLINSDGTINCNAAEVLENFNFGFVVTVGGISFSVQIINWAPSNLWRLKVNGEYTSVDELFSAFDLTALTEGKLRIVMAKKDNGFTFYVGRGSELRQVYSAFIGSESDSLSKIVFNTFDKKTEYVASVTGKVYSGVGELDKILSLI